MATSAVMTVSVDVRSPFARQRSRHGMLRPVASSVLYGLVRSISLRSPHRQNQGGHGDCPGIVGEFKFKLKSMNECRQSASRGMKRVCGGLPV